jgi:YfiH family protein
VALAGADPEGIEADAAISRQPGLAAAIQTADCLPVLFCDRRGSVVAAAHAGWRGLAAGVLENTVRALQVNAETVLAWLGPAIGPRNFEVGEDVYQAFCAGDAAAAQGFTRHGRGKWMADLHALARMRLARAGVHAVYGGAACTFSEADRFYSYRRDGLTGRMVALAWIEGPARD